MIFKNIERVFCQCCDDGFGACVVLGVGIKPVKLKMCVFLSHYVDEILNNLFDMNYPIRWKSILKYTTSQ